MANGTNIISKFVRTTLSTGHYIFVGGKSLVAGLKDDKGNLYKPNVETQDPNEFGLIDISPITLRIADVEVDVGAVNEALGKIKNDFIYLSERVNQYAKEFLEMKEDFADLGKSVVNATDTANNALVVAERAASVADNASEKATLAETTAQSAKTAVDGVVDDVTNNTKNVADLKSTTNTLSSDVSAMKPFINDLRGRMQNVEQFKLDKQPVVGTPLIDEETHKINTMYLPQGVSEIKGGNINANAKVELTGNGQSFLGTKSTTVTLVNSATSQATNTFGYKQVGNLYFVATDTFTLFGLTFEIGDWLVALATGWAKIDNVDAVKSVNGQTGDVTLTPASLGAYTKEEVISLLKNYVDNQQLAEALVGYLTSADLQGYAKTSDLSNYVPKTTTINGKALTGDVEIPIKDTTRKSLTQSSGKVSSSTSNGITKVTVSDTTITNSSYVVIEPATTATETFLAEHLSSVIVTTTANTGFSFNLDAPLPSSWSLTYYVTEVIV